MNPDFTFQQFAVTHQRCGMKVSTDGVLLGAWAAVDGGRRVLDIGCGSGLLALMVAQRNPEARVVAIDIHPGAVADARENVSCSPWSDRIDVVEGDFAELSLEVLGFGEVDLIICNPPFFATGERSADDSRATARHESSLNAVSLLGFAAGHLSAGGRLAMITSAAGEESIVYEAVVRRLNLRRLTRVYSREGRPAPIRLLWEFTREGGPMVADTLAIRDADNCYTVQYAELTREFYL